MGKILERSRFSMSREYFDIVSLDECLSNCEKICPVLINNKKKVRMHFFSRICCTPFPRIWSSRWLREAEREERSPRKDAATGLDARLEQQIVNEPRREKAHPERRGSLPSSSRLSFPPRVLSLLALLQRPRPADGPTEEHRDKFGPTLSLLFFPSFLFVFFLSFLSFYKIFKYLIHTRHLHASSRNIFRASHVPLSIFGNGRVRSSSILPFQSVIFLKWEEFKYLKLSHHKMI